MGCLFNNTHRLTNVSLSEEQTLIALWNSTSLISETFEFFRTEFNRSLLDFSESNPSKGDPDLFIKLMNQNLSQVDSSLWKDIREKQEFSVNKKNEFFEQGLFRELSQEVFSSLQSLFHLELNRLVYLFKGLKLYFSLPGYWPKRKAYKDFTASFGQYMES